MFVPLLTVLIKLVRIEAPKMYLTARFTELEAGTLATCELYLFVLLIVYLLLQSRVPFHVSFQRFEGDFDGVFLFYFRWGFEENEEIDQIH